MQQSANIFRKKFIHMQKSDMIDMLVAHYCDGNKAMFAKKLGIRPQTINSWQSRNSFDVELIFAKCEGISGDWLLSGGEGPMTRQKGEGHSVVANDHSVAALNSNISFDERKLFDEKIAHLEQLLAEKERLISVLMRQ